VSFIIYKPESVEQRAFVEFWSRHYDEAKYDDDTYAKNIGKLTQESITALFKWKNGSPLSKAKRNSLENNFIAKIALATGLRPVLDAAEFLEKFPNGCAIWRIFWLHSVESRFPIYDQHVHRAMLSIEKKSRDELSPKSDAEKIELYLTRYLPFCERFNGINRREVDRALWSYGRFLKAWNSTDPDI
jgi:hypothetical protein